MNENNMFPDVLKSRLGPREGSLKVHEEKKRDFHGQGPWRSPLLPKDKRKPEDTEKSTTLLGSIGKWRTQGNHGPQETAKGTRDRTFLEQTLSCRTHHYLNLP